MVGSSILWDPYCLAHLSWEYIEALMLREKEPPRRRVYASRGILRDSQLYEKLEALALDKEFVIYGDPAYPLGPLLMKPYVGAALIATQQEFNSCMSAV
ncbi:hypothetical protein HPB52_022989 [Rhipicephalus sanguineus]|uniref:DDE Tnp4 domain-containing protein n=1 Tax=Rhipicephalus sanguineus TaxID=34632 RepID=A0A9D4SVA6_RHISA|nr:hypothetical protein HPB52_022989 [Rhipicephalus sanguineus]